MLEARLAQYAVVARMTRSLKHALKGLSYEQMNPRWEIAEFEHHPHGWSQARRCIVARRRIEETDGWGDFDGKELSVKRSVWNSTVSEPKTKRSRAPIPVVRQRAERSW
jgi:hypothetical protein